MGIEISRTVVTPAAPPAVYAYLSDFTSTTDWDPGTVSTSVIDGDGGIGTRYANVSRFAGREVELTYVVQSVQPQREILLRAENAAVIATDTMTFEPVLGGGTRVTYRAVFTLKGLLKFVTPLFRPAFRRLGDRAEQGLQSALNLLIV